MNLITKIEFKSSPIHYVKEANGRKPNTARVVTETEDKLIRERINDIEYIRIKNIDEVYCKQSFVRKLTDITRFETNGLIMYIFSWEY